MILYQILTGKDILTSYSKVCKYLFDFKNCPLQEHKKRKTVLDRLRARGQKKSLRKAKTKHSVYNIFTYY